MSLVFDTSILGCQRRILTNLDRKSSPGGFAEERRGPVEEVESRSPDIVLKLWSESLSSDLSAGAQKEGEHWKGRILASRSCAYNV